MSSKRKPTPYRSGAKAYRGLGLGQALPIHPTKSHQPTTGLIGAESPRSGDTPRKLEKTWRDGRHGEWNLGIHPSEDILSLDVDEADAFRKGLAAKGLPLPPATIYSTARGHDSERRQLVYAIEDPDAWGSDGKMPGGEIIDATHRFIRAWPSIHSSSAAYAWYMPTTDDALGPGRELETPPALSELTILPAEYVEVLRRIVADRAPRNRETVDVDEWISERPKGKPSSDLLDLADSIPTDGIDNTDAIRYLGPLVRASWDAPGGGKAVRRGIERYAGGHGRRAELDAYRAVSNAIVDEQAVRERLALSVTFDLRPEPSVKRAKGKKKKGARKLTHEEHAPSGRAGEIPAPTKPLDVAQEILSRHVLPPLLYWRGSWHIYTDHHWRVSTAEDVENLLYSALAHAIWIRPTAKGPESTDWAPTHARVREVLRAIQSLCTLAREAEVPAWLDRSGRSRSLVPARDCLLDPRTGEVFGRSENFFSTAFVDADVAVEHQEPKHWLAFLDQAWPDDDGSRTLLQEWMGYLISGDTRRQKGMMLIGPKRSGKGTILHIAEALVGGTQGAFAATLSTFSESFGLEQAEGRSLLTLGDMRGSGREAASAAQKLLEIIGGDSIYINRKGRQAISEPLRTRVMVASNSMPRLYDDAGVIESRFLILRMRRSFAGREDLDLLSKLLPELGGIVQWSLEGYRRLEEQGHFSVPESDRDDRAELRANSAPITEFLLDACLPTDGEGSPRVEIWKAYQTWCGETGAAAMEQAQFNAAMAGAGHPAHRPRTDGHVWRYRGIRLRASESVGEKAERLWGPGGAEVVTKLS